nr:MAG TPA: hypothetical protein [Caudoviricetes sp.]
MAGSGEVYAALPADEGGEGGGSRAGTTGRGSVGAGH